MDIQVGLVGLVFLIIGTLSETLKTLIEKYSNGYTATSGLGNMRFFRTAITQSLPAHKNAMLFLPLP